MRLTQFLLRRSHQFQYWKRYVEREMNHEHLRRRWAPLVGWKEVKKRSWYYDENRPWTSEFKSNNAPGVEKRPIPIEPIKQWKFFKGDRVQILVGKDKGKHGIINSIIKERNWCFVEGLNCEYQMVSQHEGIPPACVKEERPLMVTSQVSLVDPSDEQPTDVEWRYTEDGEPVRVSVRTGHVIPLPQEADETEDFILPQGYQESDKDTKEAELTKQTFEPKLMTFDQEIMESLGIKEERKRGKTYWY